MDIVRPLEVAGAAIGAYVGRRLASEIERRFGKSEEPLAKSDRVVPEQKGVKPTASVPTEKEVDPEVFAEDAMDGIFADILPADTPKRKITKAFLSGIFDRHERRLRWENDEEVFSVELHGGAEPKVKLYDEVRKVETVFSGKRLVALAMRSQGHST